MNYTSIKNSILSLTSSALSNQIVSQVISGLTAGTALSVATLPISPVALPILLGAYVLYNNAADEQKNKAEAQKINELFEQLKKTFSPQLAEIRATEITLLEKEINNKISIEQLKELQEFNIFLIENQASSIEDIIENLSYTNDELNLLSQNSENIQGAIANLEALMSKEHSEQMAELTDIKEILTSIQKSSFSNTSSQNFEIPQIVVSLINAGTISTPITTGVGTSFDSGIGLIWDAIVKGDCNLASKKLDALFSSDIYKDNIIAKIWNFALQAKLNYTLGFFDKANIAAESAMQVLSLCTVESNFVLDSIFARYYIAKNDNTKAMELLTPIINSKNQIAMEALALSIHISDKQAFEIENKFNDEQRNHYIIAEALSCKYYEQGDFSKALELARNSFSEAKKVNALPCYPSLIAALLGHRFQSKTMTIGFIRPFINKRDWPEFHEINQVCNEYLTIVKTWKNDVALSMIYYDLAMIHFTCGMADDVDYYAQQLFNLPQIAAMVIEPCTAMWVKLGYEEKAIKAIGKRKPKLSPELLFFYAMLLFQHGKENDFQEATDILVNLISDTNCIKNIKLLSALHLGCYYLDNHEEAKYRELRNLLETQPNLNLPLRILDAYEQRDSVPENSIQIINDCIKEIPEEILRTGFFLIIIVPLLKSLSQGKIVLEIIEPFVPTDVITDIGNEYFNIAVWEKEYERVEKYCRGLRSAKCFNFDLLQSEINFLCLRSFQNAAKLVDEILSAEVDELLRKKINVWRDMVRSLLGTLKDNQVAIDDYVAVTDIDVSRSSFPWGNIPLLLKECGYYAEAINYAYELLLRFPSDSRLRKVYINTLLFCDQYELPNTYETVELNTVATIECPILNIKKEIIIENSPYATEDRNEYSSTSSWGKLLIGRKSDDFIVVSSMSEQKWKIIKIESKYSFRLRDIMDKESQSPDASMMQIYVPSDSEGVLDFSEMLKETKRLHEQQTNSLNVARHFFMEGYPSFYIFARSSLFGLEKSLRYFALQSELSISCAQGDYREREYAYKLLKSGKKILLSPMVIELLLLFEASSDIIVTDILRNSGLRFCVCEYIPEAYRLELAFPFSAERLVIQDDMLNISADQIAEKRHKALLKMMDFFNEIEVISGNLEQNEFERHENNTKWLWGRPLFQSFCLASNENDFIIWEDDANSIMICNLLYDEINITEKVFTQAVFMYLSDNNYITLSAKVHMNIFLIAINEHFTSFDAETLFEIFSNRDKYGVLQERLLRYIKYEKLELASLFNVTTRATKLWASEYSDRNNAKESLKCWFDNLSKQYKLLAKKALTEGLKAAYRHNKKKTIPILRFAMSTFIGLLEYSDVIMFRRYTAQRKKKKRK